MGVLRGVVVVVEPTEACLPQANNLSVAVFLDTGNSMSGSISILPVQVSS
jgi:hypothetical protein